MADYTTGIARHSAVHGHNSRGKRSPTYHTWTGMKARCLNFRHSRFKDYGGRGITVSNDWLTFVGFLADMGEKPEGCSLERINNSGPYCKDNCKWATSKEQNQNKRMYSNNKTGIIGVHAVLRSGRFNYWSAQCRADSGEIVTLYNGSDFFLACCARRSWETINKPSTNAE